MNRKSRKLFHLFIGIILFLLVELIYLKQTKEMSLEQHHKKEHFVTIVGLPDLALVTETSSVRHRSMSDLFSIYLYDASLREYFPSTFAYSCSGIIDDR